MRFLFVILFAVTSARAATYYAAPNATAGDGSLGDPWELQKAATNSTALLNGTLILRGTNIGGNYVGNYRFTLTNCVITNYPGEYVKLTDGKAYTLFSDINSSTTAAIITGLENGQPSQQFVFADTLGEHARLNNVSQGTNWTIDRGLNSIPAQAHTAGCRIIMKSPVIDYATSSNLTFYNIEVTSLYATNRLATSNWWSSWGVDMPANGARGKLYNSVVHDVSHPGIGYWNQGDGSEINGCVIWGVGMYDYTPDFPGGVSRGSAIYSQNDAGGFAQIKNIISFRNFTSGGKVYGETGPVFNFAFYSNIVWQCNPTLESSSGSTSTSNVWFNGNVTAAGNPLLSYVSLSNRATFWINNLVVNGSWTISEHLTATLTNNTTLMPKGVATGASPVQYTSTTITSNALSGVVWNDNTYYLGDGSSENQFAFSVSGTAATNAAGGGYLKFNNDSGKAWTNWVQPLEWDTRSTYSATWPSTQILKVFPNDFDANRWHVVLASTTAATIYAFTPSMLSAGDEYWFIKAEAWPAVAVHGTYSGSGTINLPLNTTNISALSGTITNFTDRSLNLEPNMSNVFNAFVLYRSSVVGLTFNNATLVSPTFN